MTVALAVFAAVELAVIAWLLSVLIRAGKTFRAVSIALDNTRAIVAPNGADALRLYNEAAARRLTARP